MAEQKDKKTRHLRSARQWLTRAEESFDKDRDVRGELDLFLAQAELQHAKETGGRVWLKRFPLLRHVVAVVIAISLASAGYGVYNQSGRSVLEPVPPALATQSLPASVQADKAAATQLSPVKPPAPAANGGQSEESAAGPAASRAKAPERQPESVSAEIRQPQPPPVSSTEMKSLIRAAGKSLRGE